MEHQAMQMREFRPVLVRDALRTAGILTLVGLALAFSEVQALAQQPYTMKVGIVGQNDPLHESIKIFKERVETRSNGRIKVELFPNTQLGGVPQMVQGVLLGTVEMFVAPPVFFKGTDLRYSVTDAPGLFDNMEHAHRTYTDREFRDSFLNAGEPKGVKGVSIWIYSPTSYATLTPFRRIDDFRGKKIRVLATAVETGIMKELGATGVAMDFAEALPALQNRTFDGIRSSIVVLGAAKFFTVTKYITVIEDTMIPASAMVSMAFLSKLPSELKKAVEDAGLDTEEPMLKIAKEFDGKAEQLWKDNGAEVIRLSDSDKADFMKRARAISDSVLGTDPQTKDLYEVFRRVAEKHRKKA